MTSDETTSIEIDLLFEAVFRRYGYDFRNYASSSATRRVMRCLQREKLDSVSLLQHRILRDADAAESLVRDLSINVTEMFRDPDFYRAIRELVFPELQEHAHFKLWHAGCATGEEVYSMAIMLLEAGLYERCQLYATDFNQIAVDAAKNGIYPIDRMQLYNKNYQEAGGSRSFSDYYYARYDRAMMNEKLRKSAVFALHNLATDSSFGEMQLIVCRNVLIYFNRVLQERVLQLFMDSLSLGGYLCLGSHETIKLSDLADHFETVHAKQRIYRRVR